jgi:mannosyltransferase
VARRQGSGRKASAKRGGVPRRVADARPDPWLDPVSVAGRYPAGDVALVAGFTLLAVAFHVLSQSQRPVWLDEACTYWTVRASAVDLLHGARTDGTPPLYFLIVSAATRLFGSSEIVLRLPSLLAATALAPAIYFVARLFTSRRAAVIAAALTAISPLVHYYAVEARPYGLVQLETLAILFVAYRAILEPRQPLWWAGLAVAQAIQLWTHNYALFLLPAPAVVCLLVGGRTRVALAATAALASSVAFGLYLPWFLRALDTTGMGIGEWIRQFWVTTPPYAAIFRSLEVFGFGGHYPAYLSYLGPAPDVRVLAVPLSLGLLASAVLPWAERDPREPSRPAKVVLLGFLFIPLLGAWVYSWLREPLYLVGRYDTIVLPVFLILFAAGLDRIIRAAPWVGGILAAAVVVLAAVSSSFALGAPAVADQEDVMAAQYLARQAAPGDPIVSTDYRRPVVDYYLDRSGHHAEFTSFPRDNRDHPCWYSVSHLLADPTRLGREGEMLAEQLAVAARQGHAVWLLASEADEVNTRLYDPLFRRLVIDESRSVKRARLICLKPGSGA